MINDGTKLGSLTHWLPILLCVLSFLFGSFQAQADLQAGANWLIAQQQADGSITTSNTQIATPFQSTSAALTTLHQLETTPGIDLSTASQWLAQSPFSNTEYLYHYITLQVAGGGLTTGLPERLAVHIDPQGAFASLPGRMGTPRDTALALTALAAAGEPLSDLQADAVGYLLAAQQADGSWPLISTPSLTATAWSIKALFAYRHDYQGVTEAIQQARTFLLAQRDARGLWSEPHQSALILTALIPTYTDLSPLQGGLSELSAAQASDGSWRGQVYTTALCLQAIALAGAVQTNPDVGRILGRTLDGQTQQSLPGVQVTLSGTSSQQVTTDAEGRYAFYNLTAGPYNLQLELPGYTVLTTFTEIQRGQILDLGDVLLLVDEGSTVGTVRGQIHDAQSNTPLAEVQITIVGITTT